MELESVSYKNLLSQFCISGINYRKSDAAIRGRFSMSQEQIARIHEMAGKSGISGCLALSTCNRTEIYGIGPDPYLFSRLICDVTGNDAAGFAAHAYFYQGIEAIDHLFKVASGLDSQIIGDYEILSQIKQAAKLSKESGMLSGFMERAVNYALQVSKEIKTKTALSSGTVSVSYAAIEIIKERVADIGSKKILVAGTGKFGNHIAKNIYDYLYPGIVSFTNRTAEKAAETAAVFGGNFVPYENLPEAADEADIILVSSAADTWSILPGFFTTQKSRLVLDLSVPQNVHPEVKKIAGITVLNVDEVSSILDKTINRRKAEIPKALDIINETLLSLESWHQQQANTPFLRLVKSQLFELNKVYYPGKDDEEKIHKTVSSLALKLKEKSNRGCLCLDALSGYLQ